MADLYRILKPGGVLLVAVPHMARTYRREDANPVMWGFTPAGLQQVLARVFGGENVTLCVYGNALTAAGRIRGLAAQEFTTAELAYHDPDFAVDAFARACKHLENFGRPEAWTPL